MQQDKQRGAYIHQHIALQPKISAIIRKLIIFGKRYPIPTFAIIGLLLGIIVSYVFNNPETGHWIWFIVLVVGGVPILFETIKGMLRGHFASDIVAMLAITTAIITNDAFPGVIIVIMQSGGKALEDYAFRKATSSLDELMARSPKIARRKIDENEIEDVKVEEIRIGDHLVIRSGILSLLMVQLSQRLLKLMNQLLLVSRYLKLSTQARRYLVAPLTLAIYLK